MIFGFMVVVTPARGAPPSAASLERRLLEAHTRRDATDLERAAERLGFLGLHRLLKPPAGVSAPTRSVRQAAIAAAPLLEKSWLLLPPLLELCAERDRDLALAAADAALQIAEDARAPELQANEDLPSTLTFQAGRLAALAASKQVALDVRVKLIRTLAQLLELVKLEARPLLPLLSDGEPALRRAAVELFVHPRDARVLAALVQLASSDSDPAVARAAAATLCAEVAPRGPKGREVLKAIEAAGALSALRRHFQDPAASRDMLLDIARCLRRSNTVKDRALLRSLAAGGIKPR